MHGAEMAAEIAAEIAADMPADMHARPGDAPMPHMRMPRPMQLCTYTHSHARTLALTNNTHHQRCCCKGMQLIMKAITVFVYVVGASNCHSGS